MSHAYGWKRSLNDRRDDFYKFRAKPSVLAALPARVDLTETGYNPPIWNQGNLGSCTAFASVRLAEFVQKKQSPETFFKPSTLFQYYVTREIEGTTEYDSGAYMRDALKALVQVGVIPETDWPYDISRFRQRPPASCYTRAEKNQGLVYSKIEQTLCHFQGVLASGYPFMVGMTVYQSFEDIGSDGIMPMPGPNERVLGGHAVTALGYDNSTRRVKFANSWGDWGADGYFFMPFEFLVSPDVDDCWTLVKIEEEV